MMKWHEQLRYERQSRKWTQSSLAEKIGANSYTISRWENGYAYPHPFYREKLSALLGINFDERDFLEDDALELDHNIREQSPVLSEGEQAHHEHNGKLPSSAIVAEPHPAISLVQDPPVYEREMHTLRASLSSPRLTWDARHILTSGSFKQFSWYRLSIVSIILLTAVIVIVLNRFFLFTSTSPSQMKNRSYTVSGPVPHTLTIQHMDPSLDATTRHLQQAFDGVYPQLVNRFALDPASVLLQNVTLIFASDLASPANINGMTITLSADWMRQHPTDIGLLTHELTIFVEQYPSGSPGWFSDGMADYARYVYGPASDDNWSLPDGVQPQDHYTQGGGIAARFLLWLEQHTRPDIIDQLNQALQTKQSFPDIFLRLTHHSVDGLWSQYQAHPDISQTPEQLYKTVTSRKPLYQLSSYRLQISKPECGCLAQFTIPGFSVSNFAMQADMTFISGDGGGFVFRPRGKSNASSPNYRLRLFPNGNFDLVNQSHTLTSGFNTAIKEGYNQVNQLTIIVQKHTIYIYVNGQLITTANDISLNYGAVALMANDDTSATDVRFKYVKVF